MNDLTTATAQIRLAYIYAVGFFCALFVLIFFASGVDEFGKSVLLTMLGYLGALVQQQSSYFFARQRPDTPAVNTERKITDKTTQLPKEPINATPENPILPTAPGALPARSLRDPRRTKP